MSIDRIIYFPTGIEVVDEKFNIIVDKINEIIDNELSGLTREGQLSKHIPKSILHEDDSPKPRQIKRLGDKSQKLTSGEYGDGSIYAPDIHLDEVLRKDSIATVEIAANSAVAIPHGQIHPPEYIVSMYLAGQHIAHSGVGPFSDLTDYVDDPTMPHLETDGDMEAAGTGAWTPIDATLSKVANPVHGGSQALKVEIAAGKDKGYAYQEIDIKPNSSGGETAYSFRGWCRNGNATDMMIQAFYYTGNWYLIANSPETTEATYLEHIVERKSIPAGATKLRVRFRITGAAGQFAYVDDIKVNFAKWIIITRATDNNMPHVESDGDMEAAGVGAWEVEQDAILEKVADPVHSGSKALKITIAAGQTWGIAKQELDISPEPRGSADVFSWRGWARNGNATFVRLDLNYYDGDWHALATSETSDDDTQFVELKILRKSLPAGTTKVRVKCEVNGVPGEYGYFDDVKASYPDSSVIIKQIGGTTKDFKVRPFREQAGT